MQASSSISIKKFLHLSLMAMALIATSGYAAEGKINGSRTGGNSAGAGSGKINAGHTVPGAGVAGAGAGGAGSRAPYKAAPAGYGLPMVQNWANAHRAQRPGYFYVYIPPTVLADRDLTNQLRVAIGKAWNHLSWKPVLSIPEDISEGAGLAFALNGTEIWGADANTNWGYIANCTPKANIRISPAPRDGCATFPAASPAPAPQFVFNAVNGGPYANIHKTPTNYSNFRQKFNLGPIQYVSTHKEAIVCGPRITAYRPATYNGMTLVYSYSSDEFDGRNNGDIRYTSAPTDRDQRSTGALRAAPNDSNTAIASEWWMQLPNGFMYWGIHGEGSQERGKAEFPFAIDPANWKQDYDLATGRSCITCHGQGINAAKSDDQFAGRNGWTSNEVLQNFYGIVAGKFQTSMRVLVTALSDADSSMNQRMIVGTIEPIARAIMIVEGPYPGRRGGGFCSQFCDGKYGPNSRNGKPANYLCESLPAR